MVDNVFSQALPFKAEAVVGIARRSDEAACHNTSPHYRTQKDSDSEHTQAHMQTKCDYQRLTVLLKSVCKQMFECSPWEAND